MQPKIMGGYQICIPWDRRVGPDLYHKELCDICGGEVARKDDPMQIPGVQVKFLCGACLVEMVDVMPNHYKIVDNPTTEVLSPQDQAFAKWLASGNGRGLIQAVRGMKEDFRGSRPRKGAAN